MLPLHNQTHYYVFNRQHTPLKKIYIMYSSYKVNLWNHKTQKAYEAYSMLEQESQQLQIST